MTDNELKKIADKISKLLALATSDNPTEAETAQRQANALMTKYNLTSGDAAAAQVHGKASDLHSKHRPPVYLSALASIIGKAFGCEAINASGGGYWKTEIIFLGVGIKPELASYTFDVLRRRIIKDRAAYTQSLSKRMKRENKSRKADVFCDAWLSRIHRQVGEFAGTEHEKAAIDAYKEQQWGDDLKKDERKSREAKRDDIDALIAGANAANDVSINKPVQSKRGALLT
ncbi:MAG: DUF2786 domain-containing protein [Methylovulum miyakonense]|uniref:DUF2786 domain-containing protein n=1 Tax=Methylovulum miyakonense TaxID=645578 RepID=UPI003BB690AF